MTDCREYQGRRTRDGYGVRSMSGVEVYLHRWVWAQVNGPIPPKMEIRHTCDNPPCFLLEHLLIGTHADNMRDKVERGRQRSGRSKPKDVCRLGHPIVQYASGHRLCRICKTEASRRRRANGATG